MTLSIWTVCDHPTDFPDKFVARRHAITAGSSVPTEDIITCDTIAGIRAALERKGLLRMNRIPGALPHIMEWWL